MAEISRFFDHIDGDRTYNADDFAEYFRQVLTSGILNGGENLQVYVNGTDRIARIKPGKAWIEGYFYKLTEELELPLDEAHGTYDRIDRIVVRLNTNTEARNIKAFVKTGELSLTPEPPALIREGSIYEISLAQILIIHNTTAIPVENVTDERLDPNLCGLVNSLVQVDTTVMQERFETFMKMLEGQSPVSQEEFNAHKADYASLFLTNADAKNSIYRGKYLGNTVTAEQYTAISSGTFTDLYIGDYWTIGGVNWRIAAFNYYRNTGDSSLSSNHITIVPDTQLYTHVMNDTNITTDAYMGSKMYTEGLEQAKTIIRGIFGTHLVKHRQILSNATVDGKASGWAWVDSEVELMNEIMVYGASVFGAGNVGGGSGYNIGVGKSQLPLFRLNPRMINTRQHYWLRDVVSASDFAFVNVNGLASYFNASSVVGVRPAFSIS